MNQSWPLFAAAGFTAVMVTAAFPLLRSIQRQQRLGQRARLCRGVVDGPPPSRQEALKGVWSRVVAALGHLILRTGLLSARTRAELQQTLASAGWRGQGGLEVFIGSKISLLVGLPLLAIPVLREFALPPALSMIVPVLAGVIGLLLPDIVVRYRRKQYIQRVERGLPDALDLLVICSQAGLGLTAAIVRVAEEMRFGSEDIGTELTLTANDLQFLADSRVALLNLGSRTGVEGLVRLASTLVQSMKYGTPLTSSMQMLSAEMRQESLTRFESKAARLGVLLTLPMIVFILPCVFLVVGGPAIIQVMGVGQ